MLNEDYKEMLQALADEKAEFLLVGAYALAAHGYPRATMEELAASEKHAGQISSEGASSAPPLVM